ncbi:chorismate synthase [Pandoravirus japonicus]|uniref:chorismate synthase n=1 Tax=Pandoravirus japonicus TaxID=2823154 RepID=A0A811BS36_9VIRU|nr:chorismate synthase [Pandoravirus japonicus]
MRGSQHNDPFVVKTGADGKRRLGTSTNHSGGVQGGITNGEPIVFRVRAPCASARRMLLRAFFVALSSRGRPARSSPSRAFRPFFSCTVDDKTTTTTTNNQQSRLQVAFKPPATIGSAQQTCEYGGEQATLEARGRHDPCVVARAVPIVEAMAAMVLADAALLQLARDSSLVGTSPVAAALKKI